MQYTKQARTHLEVWTGLLVQVHPLKSLELDAIPSHTTKTYVNFMSKSQVVNTFWVGQSFLPQKQGAYDRDTFTCIWVPSIAPKQS